MPLAQSPLYGEDEEDLYPRHPTTKHLVPALLNQPDRHGVQ
jgi:hypothetical protein